MSLDKASDQMERLKALRGLESKTLGLCSCFVARREQETAGRITCPPIVLRASFQAGLERFNEMRIGLGAVAEMYLEPRGYPTFEMRG